MIELFKSNTSSLSWTDIEVIVITILIAKKWNGVNVNMHLFKKKADGQVIFLFRFKINVENLNALRCLIRNVAKLPNVLK